MVIEIPLTQGKVAIIDDCDVALVSRYKWCAANNKDRGWYALRRVKKSGGWSTQRMHQLILQTAGFVDHIDGDGLNNRRSNLRKATPSQNAQNRKKILSSTGYRNVYEEWSNYHMHYFYRAEVAAPNRVRHRKRFSYTKDGLQQAVEWAAAKRRELGFFEGAA